MVYFIRLSMPPFATLNCAFKNADVKTTILLIKCSIVRLKYRKAHKKIQMGLKICLITLLVGLKKECAATSSELDFAFVLWL